jgi:ABC-2 type transport system permease protein
MTEPTGSYAGSPVREPPGAVPPGAEPTNSAAPQPAGVIHDIGYRGYEGLRLGRSYAVWSLFTQSLRGAWGIGRGTKAKLIPFGMLAFVLVPALIWSAVGNQLNRRLVDYVDFPVTLQMPIIIFLAAQSVELLSRDLRHSVLPLYFSRPLRRDDYVWAKFAAMAAALAMLMVAPVVLAYFVAAFDGNNDTTLWDETTAAAGGVGTALLHAVVLAALSLVIAAFATKRVYTIGAIVALFLISSAVSGIVEDLSHGRGQELAGIITPFRLLAGTYAWLSGTETEVSNVGGSGWVYGLATAGLLAVCTGLLLLRYRRVGR